MCVWNILAILRLSGEILEISIGNECATFNLDTLSAYSALIFVYSLKSLVYVSTFAFYFKNRTLANTMFNEDLNRPCDACGKPIGGGYKHCPKCKICFCWYRGVVLMQNSKELPVKCPMCCEKLK